MDNIEQVKNYLLSLQTSICAALEAEEKGALFVSYPWQDDALGYGLTRVIERGAVFEKGGVNFSHVSGLSLPPAAVARHPEIVGAPFEALGISLVLHPLNPYVPTTHANFRFFTTTDEREKPVWWFGGGFDLTPYYGFAEDCIHWHRQARQACDPFGSDVYPRFKKWCDEYFYLRHRQEPRGVGGLFFDDLKEWGFEQTFAFVQSVGNHFLPAYQPIVAKRKAFPFSLREQQFQYYRRGRYVEFNLLYDRGTLFGLQTSGRTESILMSLPPKVEWRYDWQPAVNDIEASLTRDFITVKEWLPN